MNELEKKERDLKERLQVEESIYKKELEEQKQKISELTSETENLDLELKNGNEKANPGLNIPAESYIPVKYEKFDISGKINFPDNKKYLDFRQILNKRQLPAKRISSATSSTKNHRKPFEPFEINS